MLLSPECIYEDCKKKSLDEILSDIYSFKTSMGQLKSDIEYEAIDRSCRVIMCPSRELQIDFMRQYINAAKLAYEERGGEYILSKSERRSQEFEERLLALERIEFVIGGYFATHTKRVISFESSQVFLSVFSTFSPADMIFSKVLTMTRNEFIERIKSLYIGEWHRNYRNPYVLDGTQWEATFSYSDGGRPITFYGSNKYPYNFNDFAQLFQLDDDEVSECQ